MNAVLSWQENTPIGNLEDALKTSVVMLSFHEDCTQDEMHENVVLEMQKRNSNCSGSIAHFVFPLSDEIIASAFSEFVRKQMDQALSDHTVRVFHDCVDN